MTTSTWTREQRKARKALIRLLEGYFPVLSPDLQAAVLAARGTVPQVTDVAEGATQICGPGPTARPEKS